MADNKGNTKRADKPLKLTKKEREKAINQIQLALGTMRDNELVLVYAFMAGLLGNDE